MFQDVEDVMFQDVEDVMFQDVEDRMKRNNQILFGRDSRCLQDLLAMIRQSDHRTLILWALDCAQTTLNGLEQRQPEEGRPRRCLEQASAWSRGEIKMAAAKRAILDCHAAARGLDPVSSALCHAIGHAGATVHVETHAIGLPLYELTSLVRECQGSGYEAALHAKIDFYEARLRCWENDPRRYDRTWAAFLLKGRGNREQQLWAKLMDRQPEDPQ